MPSTAANLLTVGIGLLGVVVWLGLSVYPFQYGPVESAVFAGLLVVAGLFQFVLDDAFAG